MQSTSIRRSHPFLISSNGNFGQNVEFFYSNGTVIPSWLESYSGSNAIWWLKLGSIPASSSITVYMGIASTSANLFNTVNDGEAPQLTCSNPSDTSSCSTYAEYDDGANVFNNYWDFAGSSMPSGFTFTSGLKLTVTNGLTINSTEAAQYGYYSAASYSTNTIVEEDLEFTGIASIYSGQAGVGITDTSISEWSSFALNNPGAGSGEVFNGYLIYGTSIGSSLILPLKTPVILSFAGSASGMKFYTDYSQLYETSTAIQTPYYLVIAQAGYGAVFTIYWLRTRAYPPNGVMPSASFGSVA